ncbi:cytochrome P450 2J5-like [Anolis sagrei]|uniref:cytochrome P450 2J5-like n=1 Tax=Anolis sagrei TaxID=38937 RepID=UPI0035221EED
MAEIQLSLSVLLPILLLLYFLKLLWSRRHYPPGPLAFPIIGGLWRIAFEKGIDGMTAIKAAKQYGNVFTLWLGHFPMVFLSGFDAVKEGMVDHSEELLDRGVTPFFEKISEGKGVGFTNGHAWKQQRRLVQMALVKLGVGKRTMEDKIEDEAQQLVEIFASQQGKPFDPELFITNAVSNVTFSLMYGYRWSVEDPNFKKLIKTIEYTLSFGLISISYILYELFPSLMDRLPGPHKKALETSQMLLSLSKEEIRKHREQESTQEPRDFIDYYLREMEKEKNKNDPTSTVDEENLMHSILDIYFAGLENITTVMKWALLILANRPDVQDKIIKEIEDVVGSSNICYDDHKRLPYTHAVIHEIQRYRYPMLVGIARQATRDVHMRGYIIPKGTYIAHNLRSVLLDDEYWETPHKFNPNHFLDKDGNFVARKEFLGFGTGPRSCLGENVARMELFIFLTRLLRVFHFQPPPGVKEFTEEPARGASLPPHPYKVCAIPRNS